MGIKRLTLESIMALFAIGDNRSNLISAYMGMVKYINIGKYSVAITKTSIYKEQREILQICTKGEEQISENMHDSIYTNNSQIMLLFCTGLPKRKE